MSVLLVTITDPKSFDERSPEIDYLLKLLGAVGQDIRRGKGIVTNGSIIGTDATGSPNGAVGNWIYLPGASKP
jgi:hypothetical protein